MGASGEWSRPWPRTLAPGGLRWVCSLLPRPGGSLWAWAADVEKQGPPLLWDMGWRVINPGGGGGIVSPGLPNSSLGLSHLPMHPSTA